MAPSSRRAPLVALAAAAVMALTGCGIHPGQAAVVGSTDISPDEVDQAAAVVCLVDQSVNGVQSVARRKAVDFLVGAELIEMFGTDVGALPTGGELSESPAVEQIERESRALPAAVRQDYVDTITRLLTSQQTLINAGQEQVAEGGGSASDLEGALAAGTATYTEWLEEKAPDISVDPRFGEWQGSQLVPSDSSLSVAVSDQATQLDTGAGTRPATQVCS